MMGHNWKIPKSNMPHNKRENNCSFDKYCLGVSDCCDKEEERGCKTAKIFRRRLGKPCRLIKGAKVNCCDIEEIRAILPGRKCSHNNECLRAYVPELREFLKQRRGSPCLTKKEGVSIRDAASRFFTSIEN